MSAQGQAQASSPASPPQVPGFPENAQLLVFDKFATLQTKSLRPAIKDEEMSWCDGFMPVGPNNLRTLFGKGPALYTAAAGITIPYFNFWNIGTTPICVALLSDGSIQQINTSTSGVTQIAPAGTILNPSNVGGIDTTTWGSQYLLICASQANGYWLWDGSVLYGAGTLAPPVTVTAGGSGYTTATVAASGGSGSGATFSVTIVGGVVTTINITNAGTGYKAGDTVTLAVSGDGSGATATVTLMPFGVMGSAIETYQSHVWVANGNKITFSAPGSPTDFATSDGGGSFTSFDSFLNIGFTFLKQSNGFLYLVADSSMSYISGVQTTGVGSPPVPTTTFQYQNVDPQIGTPWHPTVQLFSRNIVFGNTFGVFVSYGGAVTKVSSPLDGIYNTVPNFAGFLPSSAVATIFGIEVFMQLTPIIDPFDGDQVNKLLMWDGQRWWTSEQDINLTYIASQKINSVLTAWGTDGSAIYPLFQTPSTAIQKVAQSKLWDKPHYLYTKTGLRLYGVLNFFQTDSQSVQITIDNESGVSSYNITAAASGFVWLNNSDQTFTWTNNVSEPFLWSVGGTSGLVVFGPEAVSQFGRLIGMTVITNTSNMALVSASVMGQEYQANV